MKHIVHSQEADAIFRDTLKAVDPRAFTKQGVIHSYTIADDTIEHSPMGGIMVDLYANDDPKLNVGVHLDKNGGKGRLIGGPMSSSVELDNLIDAEKVTDKNTKPSDEDATDNAKQGAAKDAKQVWIKYADNFGTTAKGHWTDTARQSIKDHVTRFDNL